MHVENRYFFIFQNILELKRIFEIVVSFFQILLSTIFYKKSGTFNETFLTWSSLTCNIFSKKSWFLFSDKSQVQKSGDVITCFFCAVKNKNSEAARLIVETPSPLSSVIFLKVFGVCVCVCVCVFCLFTPFLSALFVFHRKNLVFSHLMYRYTT